MRCHHESSKVIIGELPSSIGQVDRVQSDKQVLSYDSMHLLCYNDLSYPLVVWS